MSRDEQILDFLKKVDRNVDLLDKNATNRDTWYREKLEACQGSVNKLITSVGGELANLDKRISLNEQKFNSFRKEVKQETAVTRTLIVVAVVFGLLIVGIMVSWYAKQPPTDVHPLAIAKDITAKIR